MDHLLITITANREQSICSLFGLNSLMQKWIISNLLPF